MKEITAKRGISDKTVYSWIKKGLFPKGEKVGPKAVRWKDSVVEEAFARMAGGNA
ncbi:MAG TPA: AlpA family phage regulatory protein [Ramlibacter sp.]|jgi:predicted DNA-binding transcriptional regulator AlpA